MCVSTVMSEEQARAEAPAGARQRRRSELEGYSVSLASLKLSPMYPEEEQRTTGGISSTAHYLDGTFNYTTNPDATNSSVDYYSVAPEPQEENLQPLPNGSSSPPVFVPSSPQLSPFLGHPPAGQHTAQQVPYYLEPSGTSIYRSEGLGGIETALTSYTPINQTRIPNRFVNNTLSDAKCIRMIDLLSIVLHRHRDKRGKTGRPVYKQVSFLDPSPSVRDHTGRLGFN